MDEYDMQLEFCLTPEEFPDTIFEDKTGWPQYEHEVVVEATSDNITFLIEKYNELVIFLSEKLGDEIV